jgi:hypothetical protein
MSSPALIFGMQSFYHSCTLALKLISTDPPPDSSFWTKNGSGILTSLIATILTACLAVVYRARLQPIFTACSKAITLYSTLHSIDMRAFNRSRDDYKRRRTGDSISRYIGTARFSLRIVSFSFLTGMHFEDVAKQLRSLVERDMPVDVEISLLDPRKADLVSAISPAYGISPSALASHIQSAMDNLVSMRRSIRADAQPHLKLYFHSVIPFASAILIDCDQPDGRIQIETKAYKSGLDKSWGFELGNHGSHPFYSTLADAYKLLIKDAEPIQ